MSRRRLGGWCALLVTARYVGAARYPIHLQTDNMWRAGPAHISRRASCSLRKTVYLPSIGIFKIRGLESGTSYRYTMAPSVTRLTLARLMMLRSLTELSSCRVWVMAPHKPCYWLRELSPCRVGIMSPQKPCYSTRSPANTE